MKVKLIEWAMGQPPDSFVELQPHAAELLIRRGAAVAVDEGKDAAPVTEGLGVPKRNKSLAARQMSKG